MLKNNIKKRISAVIATVLLIAVLLSLNIYADGISFSVSSPTVTEGSNVSVTVKSSSAVAGVNLTVTYDTSSLEYVSYSGASPNVSNGIVNIVDYRTSGAAVYSETLVFKTKKVGTSSVKITKCEASTDSGDLLSGSPSSGTVTVKAKPVASSDATLKSLSVSPGKLSPAFSSSETEYEVSVANSVTSIAISAKTNHSAAKYSVSGNTKLSVGNNTVKIRVAAENGATKTYIITVKRAAAEVTPTPEPDTPEPTPTPTPDPEEPQKIIVKNSEGKEFSVSEFDDSLIPAGFERTEISIGENKVQAITLPESDGNIALYLSADGENGFYYYDISTGTVAPIKTVSSQAYSYTVLNVAETMTPPDGYVREYITVGENSFYAFSPADRSVSPETYIIYAVSPEGKVGFYVYDITEGTFQRYGIISAKKEESPVVDEEEKPEYPEYTKWIFYGVSGVAGLFLILFIVFLVLYIKTVKSYKKLLAAKRRAAARRREKMLLMKAEEEKAKSEQETVTETVPDETPAEPEQDCGEETELSLPEDEKKESLRTEEISIKESAVTEDDKSEDLQSDDDTDISFLLDDEGTPKRKNRGNRENRKDGKDEFDAEMIDLLFPQEDPDDDE